MAERKYIVIVAVTSKERSKFVSKEDQRFVTYHSCSNLKSTFKMLDTNYSGNSRHPVYGCQWWIYATVYDKETREELGKFSNIEGKETRPSGKHYP